MVILLHLLIIIDYYYMGHLRTGLGGIGANLHQIEHLGGPIWDKIAPKMNLGNHSSGGNGP